MKEEVSAHLIIAVEIFESLHLLGRDAERALEMKQRIQSALRLLNAPEQAQDLSSKPLEEKKDGC